MTLAEAHILLVDDEPILRMTLALVLRGHGATVTEAANGAEALVVMRDSGPAAQAVDLLLTDRHMPGMDGPALLQALAAEGRTVPTVLCTGTLGDGTEPDLAPFGVKATLVKPFAPTAMIATLEAVVENLQRT